MKCFKLTGWGLLDLSERYKYIYKSTDRFIKLSDNTIYGPNGGIQYEPEHFELAEDLEEVWVECENSRHNLIFKFKHNQHTVCWYFIPRKLEDIKDGKIKCYKFNDDLYCEADSWNPSPTSEDIHSIKCITRL